MAGVTTDIAATPVTAIRRAMTFTATRADPALHGATAMATEEATLAQAGAADEVMVVVMAGEAVAVVMAEVGIGNE
jgi:Trk K+ transport system NAD-binding subunit